MPKVLSWIIIGQIVVMIVILDGFVQVNDKINYKPSKKINLLDNIVIQIPQPKFYGKY